MIRWSCASVYPTLRLLLAGLEDNTVKKPSRRPWVLPDRAFVSFLMPFRIRSSLEPTLSKYKYVTLVTYITTFLKITLELIKRKKRNLAGTLITNNEITCIYQAIRFHFILNKRNDFICKK